MLDLLIQNGTLVMPDGLQVGDLAIHGGRITAVGMPGALPTARRAWDAAGCFVLPGGIDPHVHIHWPFLAATTADDYAIASRAAALGGTTTVIDFAHPKMGPTPLDRVAYRQSEANGRSIIDYGLHCVLTEGTPEILDQMARLVSQGVTSFKMYMAYSRRGIMVSDATLLSVMQQAARLGALACIHGENGTVADAIEARFLAEGRTAATDFPQHKPNFVEAEAIERAIFWARQTGARLYVFHLSTAEGLALIRSAQRQGVRVVAETCPQYLLLDDAVFATPGAGHRFICSPPIRSRRDNEALWDGIAEGVITTIGTDHCAFTIAQKDRGRNNFVDVPNGLPGIETRLGLLYTEGVCQGRISMPDLVRIASTNVARTFGLPRKGGLLPGMDADVVVYDPGSRGRLTSDALHMGVDWTPYEGWEMQGTVALTVAGGEIIAERGQIVGERLGRFVPRVTQ